MYKPHVLVTFGGTLGQAAKPVEEWSCGIRVDVNRDGPLPGGGTISVEQQEEYLYNTAIPALTSWFSNAALTISSLARITWVKVNSIDEQGHYAHEQTSVAYDLSIGGGASGTTNLRPTQVSLAVTFEAEANRGLASKGRIFLPMPTAPLNTTTLCMERGAAEGIVDVTVEFLKDLQTSDVSQGLTYTPSIFSKISRGGQDQVQNDIVRVSVDTRLDVQRSRANQLTSERVRNSVD